MNSRARTIAAAAAAGLALLASGCTGAGHTDSSGKLQAFARTNWVKFRFGTANTGFNRFEHVLSVTTVSRLVKAWSFHTRNSVTSSPAVANGVVYLRSASDVYALNAATGAKRWSYHITGFNLLSSPAVADGVVYVGSIDDNVYAFALPAGR